MALEKRGAHVLPCSADVADLPQMQVVVEQARQQFEQIHGVFHAAGVPGAGLMQMKTREAAEQVFAPKVWGTLVLDSLFKESELDFMLLYSSTTAITGGLGEVDYCAANAFLDAYAHYNQIQGRFPTISVNWGAWQWDAWQNEQLRVWPEIYQTMKTMRETYGLTFEQGYEALTRALACDLTQVVISRQDLSELQAWLNTLSMKDFEDTLSQSDTHHPSYPRPRLRTAYVPPSGDVEEAIAKIWAEALSLEHVGIHDQFFELGGNSLIGMRIVAQMNKGFHVNLSAAILYESPTISTLSKLLSPDKEPEPSMDSHLERGKKRKQLQAKRRKGRR